MINCVTSLAFRKASVLVTKKIVLVAYMDVSSRGAQEQAADAYMDVSSRGAQEQAADAYMDVSSRVTQEQLPILTWIQVRQWYQERLALAGK